MAGPATGTAATGAVRARARTGLLLGLLAYASWGLLSPLGKHLLDDFEPLQLNFVRFALAAAVYLAAVGPKAAGAGIRLMRHGGLAWVNLLANVSLTLFLFSLVRLDATYATLGFYTAPLWTALLAGILLKERVGPWFAPAVVAMLAGGYIALFGLAAPSGSFSGLGMALAIGSAVIWGYYAVQLRRHAPSLDLKPLMAASLLWGALYYGVLSLLFEGPPALASVPASSWAWMAVYVAVPTLASFILFNAAMQRAGAGPVNLLVGAELAFTVVFAMLILGDRFTPGQGLGLVLVLASVTAYLWVRERGSPGSRAG